MSDRFGKVDVLVVEEGGERGIRTRQDVREFLQQVVSPRSREENRKAIASLKNLFKSDCCSINCRRNLMEEI